MKFSSSILLTLASTIFAFDPKGNNNVAMYYGQNSAGGADTQMRLGEYCTSGDNFDIVLMSFMHVFPDNAQVNFANACEDGKNGAHIIKGTDLLQCPDIASDIKTCQDQGKKILLSLGGASGAYGFKNDQEGKDFADQLWDLFGNGDGKSASERPFKDSILDGFDLDIEGGGSTGYAAMVNQLRSHFDSDSSKDYYISAAPQCPVPDAFMADAIEKSDIDFLFVQFYNNYCGINNDSQFNYGDWVDYVKTKSKNKDAKIFIGVPGSTNAASTGYVSASTVVSKAKDMQSKYADYMGGVSCWDMSQAWANKEDGKNFAEAVKSGL